MDSYNYLTLKITCVHNVLDNNQTSDAKPRLLDEVTDKNKNWKLTDITDPGQCRSLRLPDAIHGSNV